MLRNWKEHFLCILFVKNEKSTYVLFTVFLLLSMSYFGWAWEINKKQTSKQASEDQKKGWEVSEQQKTKKSLGQGNSRNNGWV